MIVPRYLVVRVTEAVCVSPAGPLPVTVRGKVPRDALLLVVIVRVALPEPTSVAGVKVALVPVGRPRTARPTDPLKPPWEDTETL